MDDSSIKDIFDTFEWALNSFDNDVFFNETILVTPTEQHFPGRQSSPLKMSQLILELVQGYAGLTHWPFKLGLPTEHQPSAQLTVLGALRGSKGQAVESQQSILIPYDLDQLNEPEVMIASFAHMLSHYLGLTAKHPAPAKPETWPHLTEILATFLGFGIEMSNTAYIAPKTGCANCHTVVAQRQSYLTEEENIYALAIFCRLKEIPSHQVKKHLKKTLRSLYNQAAKDVKKYSEKITCLKEIKSSLYFEQKQAFNLLTIQSA